MGTRRIVAATQDGRSKVVSDDVGLTNGFSSVPGFDPTVVWATQLGEGPAVGEGVKPGGTLLPDPGGTTLFVVTFPPDSVMMSPEFDGAAAGAEYATKLPGLAEQFEVENPGVHRTWTIDYDIMLHGELWCEFDEGEVHLKAGDVLVQYNTRHAWRNRGSEAATIIFVLIGMP